jgi:hypothetical protein
MIGMIVHAELAPYDFSHAAAGPQLRGETGGDRIDEQEFAQSFTLRVAEHRLRSELRARHQSLVASFTASLFSPLHARQAHAKNERDVRYRHSLPEELDDHAAANGLVLRDRGCAHSN